MRPLSLKDFPVRSLYFGLGLGLGFWLFVSTAAMAQSAAPRLGQLHDALRLSVEQEDAWRDYTAAISSNPQADARHRAARAMMPKLTTPRRLALMDATMEQDLADLRREGQAVIAFYNRLTPSQQAVFDRQTLPAEREGAGN
jgi:hypothetical protein